MTTPYPDLNDVLHKLVTSMQAILAENFVGAYLQGSFAVGDFDEHSDVDWVAVLERDLTEDEVLALNAMHERIYALPCEWAKHLEGSYFPKDMLRDVAKVGQPVWYLDHGSQNIIQSDHCNTVLVRWVVRERGVTLAGPDPASLIDPVPIKRLHQHSYNVIHAWGRDILANPEPYNNRFYQAFIVLNYSRMLHDLCLGDHGSKRTGAEWAKANLDPKWIPLIDRSWSGRPNPAVSVRTRPDPDDFKATLDYVRYVMEESKRYTAFLGD